MNIRAHTNGGSHVKGLQQELVTLRHLVNISAIGRCGLVMHHPTANGKLPLAILHKRTQVLAHLVCRAFVRPPFMEKVPKQTRNMN